MEYKVHTFDNRFVSCDLVDFTYIDCICRGKDIERTSVVRNISCILYDMYSLIVSEFLTFTFFKINEQKGSNCTNLAGRLAILTNHK